MVQLWSGLRISRITARYSVLFWRGLVNILIHGRNFFFQVTFYKTNHLAIRLIFSPTNIHAFIFMPTVKLPIHYSDEHQIFSSYLLYLC